MKSRNLLVACIFAASAPSMPAEAAVYSTFSVTPDLIVAAEQSVLDLQLNLSADAGYYNAQFLGGTATLYSGDGASTSFNIGTGGNFRDYSFSFSYPDPGSYAPSFSVIANYVQSYDAYVYLYTNTYQVFVGYGYYSCGFFSTCSYPIYQTVNQPVYGWQTYSNTQVSQLDGQAALDVNSEPASVVSTPVPAALPLFAAGLGVIGLLARRSKRTGAKPA